MLNVVVQFRGDNMEGKHGSKIEAARNPKTVHDILGCGLSTETVEGTARTLEGIHDVQSCDSLPAEGA